MTRHVVVVRKDLNMSAGKIGAQIAHAILRTPNVQQYEFSENNKCVTCQVKSEQKLLNLAEKVKESGLPYGLQIDAGRTEIAPKTYTVLSIGPVSEDDFEKFDSLTKRLQVYKDDNHVPTDKG